MPHLEKEKEQVENPRGAGCEKEGERAHEETTGHRDSFVTLHQEVPVNLFEK